MRIALPLLAFGLALQGCIIYDHDCPGCDPDRPDREDRDPWDDDCDGDPEDPCTEDDTGDPDDTGEVEQPPPPDYGFVMTPEQAEQGEVFIASLKAQGEDELDLATIAEISLFGDVEILAEDLRSREILLTIQVDTDAEPGLVDLLVELDDGSAAFEDGILRIFPAGSGHEAGSSDDGSDPCE
jgi:hypothetical protein